MFEEICSIYSDALDNVGRYVDMETGECIQQMSIREFCLTDRWKPYVEKLRSLRKEYGSKAKKMPEYVSTKKHLPGATLSGLFEPWEDDCVSRDGRKYRAVVSRRGTHLKQHTGWLSIDIDLDDNQRVADFENIRMVCRFRPEIALLMRSCSGTGYFGLVRLAYPDRHKEQFKALLKEYAALGITLDKQCGNIGRVRFASWDDPSHIYINERATAYYGLDIVKVPVSIQRFNPYSVIGGHYCSRPDKDDNCPFWEQQRVKDRLVEMIVAELVRHNKNITESYDDWCKAGWALQTHPYGKDLFHILSNCSKKYNYAETERKWYQLGYSKTVTYNYLIHACKEYLGDALYKQICHDVWEELK